MKPDKILLPIAFGAIAIFSACKQDAKQAPVNTAPPPPAAKPEVYLYVNTVSKLNLREQPDKKAQVITQLNENEFVEGNGEVSANKEEVMLRDVMFLEPYFKVVTTGEEMKTGWAYGGALRRIYAGSRTGIPDREKLTLLTEHLKTLDTKKLESGKKAWDFVDANFDDASGPLADAAFILLEAFLFRMEREGEYYTLTEKVQWAPEDYKAIAERRFNVNTHPVTRSLAENGFELAQGEGMVFPVVDWNKFKLFFEDKVTPAMKAFLVQETAERNKQAFSDGGIVITLEELADRAAFWEKFNRNNPYFVLIEQTSEYERWTRLVLVNGADNTPVFNYETKDILEDYKKVWTYIQQQYPDTELAKTAKEIADLCAAEGWKRTPKVEEWQTKFADKS